jgi:hypothetical protein
VYSFRHDARRPQIFFEFAGNHFGTRVKPPRAAVCALLLSLLQRGTNQITEGTMNSEILHRIVRAPADEAGSSGSGSVTDTLAEARQMLADTAKSTARRVKTATRETAERARTEAERIATEKKQDTAQRIDTYGNAIHESARSLERDDPNIAWLTHRAADRLQNVANYVRTQDFGALRRDAEDVARRHPAAFFGGMFVVGLFLGNILKAHRPAGVEETDNENFSADDIGADSPAAAGI